jgi:hypothetical protein
MKKTTLLLILCISMLSCTKDNPNNSSFLIDREVYIYLKNNQGENLLNTANYNSENFKIYYEINGQKIEVNNPLLDASRGFVISDWTNPISMGVALNDVIADIPTITYIEWNDTDTDTLKTSYIRTENSFIWDKLWVNGELVWQPGTPSVEDLPVRIITIVK